MPEHAKPRLMPFRAASRVGGGGARLGWVRARGGGGKGHRGGGGGYRIIFSPLLRVCENLERHTIRVVSGES